MDLLSMLLKYKSENKLKFLSGVNVTETRCLQNTSIQNYSNPLVYEQLVYEMHKLIPVFQFMSQFLLIQAPSYHKPVVIPDASSREVMGN
jgi:hypothetical protein